MHRYFKTLTAESFRSTSTSENSHLNQETSEHTLKHKPQILTQILILRLVGEVELIQVLFSQIQLKENQFHIIIQMSMMKIVNTNLRNRTLDEFLNDTVITYFEDDLFETVSNDDSIYRFQNMKIR